MSDFRAQAIKIANEEGIRPALFLALVQHESGWNAHATSPVGAKGLTQLMPATARELGVNPDDPLGNLRGGARYLKRQLDAFGSEKLALAAYNAGPGAVHSGAWQNYSETRNYVSGILHDAPKGAGTKTRGPDLVTPAGGVKPGKLTDKSPLATPTAAPISAPSPSYGIFGSDQAEQSAFDNLGRIAQGWKPTSTLGLTTPAIPQPAQTLPETQPTPSPSAPVSPTQGLTAPRAPAPQAPSKQPVTPGRKVGIVSVASGANRHGAALHPEVVQFVRQIAGVHGSELTITTGTNHNQYVHGEPGRQSRHWTGMAADISYGHGFPGHPDAKLTKLGQDALIAAGMPVAEARKQTGGVYNLGGKQVIFNSMVGGNHFNHLHVGL